LPIGTLVLSGEKIRLLAELENIVISIF
jgi:hypothetical protein